MLLDRLLTTTAVLLHIVRRSCTALASSDQPGLNISVIRVMRLIRVIRAIKIIRIIKGHTVIRTIRLTFTRY